MSREYRLQKLLKHPHIWRPGTAVVARRTVPTGFAVLDRRLGGGWPVEGLTELLFSKQGIGELRLLMPALAFLSRAGSPEERQDVAAGDGGWIAWVAPPHIPYAPALGLYGVDTSRVLVIRPDKQADVLWAMEQALRSSTCVAVLAWLAALDERSMRRLRLAAESGLCWAVIFRHLKFAHQGSPAPLRIQLQPEDGQLGLDIIRNRYGAVGSLLLQC
ncbi:MAG: translesion DNA synthesis-associated protein ImuA [Gammaproteobacteria bacterium]|nr:translesion DNA synthesis-associated protein ImuA [Gammaproteobacteria bacterium]MDP7094508.1 translesion DNA synthesis-associated protein ImuA [Gammaproteobacteria bacterium]MDP7269756.1 translesion DNA synthesis-associated protein ImuA [Gammaproteobacteria bacterium]HJP03639.1 translesion DNA synthesis-associated protein ImuA [Gammaproteobacteria bacterium]